MKRLLIDVNPVVPYYVSGKVNGIGRTAMELVMALNELPHDAMPFDLMLYSQNMKGIGARDMNTRFKAKHVYLRNNNAGDKIVKAFKLREILTRYDLMHITSNYANVAHPERCIVTIHDAMFFSYPESFLGHDMARKLYPPFARKSKAIITCSENSKQEIVQYMDVPEDKISVCYWGVDHNMLRPHEVDNNRYTCSRPYFISVSCDIGRKNTISVVKAYIKFAKQNPSHELILVWRRPPEEIVKMVAAAGLTNKVHFASNISNEELSDLYAGATCTFFPSKYEGYGLPVAESMACATPVVTCRNSSLAEIGGEAALYVEPDDVDAMALIMEQFENGYSGLAELRQRSYNQSLKFTWDSCARKTVEVYRKCLGV